MTSNSAAHISYSNPTNTTLDSGTAANPDAQTPADQLFPILYAANRATTLALPAGRGTTGHHWVESSANLTRTFSFGESGSISASMTSFPSVAAHHWAWARRGM